MGASASPLSRLASIRLRQAGQLAPMTMRTIRLAPIAATGAFSFFLVFIAHHDHTGGLQNVPTAALFLSIGTYELFLFLIGSVFVPLFGVFAADYFVLRHASYGRTELFERGGPSWFHGGVRWRAFVPWAAGFALYQWSVPTGPSWWAESVRTLFHAWLHLPFPLFGSALGASLPSFLAAFAISLVLLPGGDATRPADAPRGEAPRQPDE